MICTGTIGIAWWGKISGFTLAMSQKHFFILMKGKSLYCSIKSNDDWKPADNLTHQLLI